MKITTKTNLNDLLDTLSKIGKVSIVYNNFNSKDNFLYDGGSDYATYLLQVLKATVFLMKTRILLIKDIFSKDISPNKSQEYLLISRYFTLINNHIRSFILVDLINSTIWSPFLYAYTDDLEYSAESLFFQNKNWQIILREAENVLYDLEKYLIDVHQPLPYLTEEQNNHFLIINDFVNKYSLVLKEKPINPVIIENSSFPVDHTKFYITKKDGNYYYKNEYLKHNVGKGYHSQVLIITLNLIGSSDQISYKELLPYIRTGIPKLKNTTDSELRSIIQKSLTSMVHGVNRDSKKQTRLFQHNGTPIFQNIKNLGLSFLNRI